MRSSLFGFCTLFITLSLQAYIDPGIQTGQATQRAPAVSIGEDLFKWGEYDSLVRLLEPVTQSGTLGELRTEVDSAQRAKSYLFLGVAFFATGKKTQADDAFTKACDLDPWVKLDRFYVTEEIANYFQAIAMDGIRRRKERVAFLVTAGSQAVSLSSGPAFSPNSNSKANQPRQQPSALKKRESREWLWWSMGVGAFVAAGGTVLYLAQQNPPKENITRIDAR